MEHNMDLASLTQSLGLPELNAGNVLAGGFLITAATYILSQIRGIFSPIFSYYTSKWTTFVELKDNHPTYSFAALALSQKLKSKRGRFKVESNRHTAYGEIDTKTSDWYLLPGYGLHIVYIGGSLCFARFAVRNLEHKDEHTGKSYEETISMWFPFADNSVIKRVIEDGRALYKEFESKTMQVSRFSARRDYWDGAGVVKRRELDNIILPKEQKQNIIKIVEDFVSNKEWFEKRSLPYKTGFLFYGPPGTGKTSIVAAIAHKYRMPIYSLSLSSTSCNDEELISLIKQIPEKSILLFEDIDKIQITNKDHKKETLTKITLSGILNALDGINSGEGFITIMTANNPELIDPALLRPGRIDQKILFDNPSVDSIKEFIYKFYDTNNLDLEESARKIHELGWSMAALQSYCLIYKKEPFNITIIKNIEDFNSSLKLNPTKPTTIEIGSIKRKTHLTDIIADL